MLRLDKIIKLLPEERVIKIIHQAWLTFLLQIFLAILLIVLPFFLMFPLFQLGSWGIAVFLILILIALIYSLRVLFIAYCNTFVLTNKRLIDIEQKGIFSRTISEIPFRKIDEVLLKRKGIFQTVFGYGTLTVRVKNSPLQLELRHIKQPQETFQLINGLMEEDEEQKSNAVKKIKKEKANEEENIARKDAQQNASERALVLEGNIEELTEEEISELISEFFSLLVKIQKKIGKEKFKKILKGIR